ncbi:hypothetical protein LK10_12485 [Sinomonas humi]|uniref:Flagellar hook-length control protein-like C-terminal domain-containing protein n=2 Tax=Sinomonas humi TaxID=1338436 RepID=A0A0B2AKU8_9MICC|nr:hypothetical protein LK10_12485 [Sinomonas humi]
MPAVLSALPAAPPAVTQQPANPGATGPDAGSSSADTPGLFAALLAAVAPGASSAAALPGHAGAVSGGVDPERDPKSGTNGGFMGVAGGGDASGTTKGATNAGSTKVGATKAGAKDPTNNDAANNAAANNDAEGDPALNAAFVGQVPTVVPPFVGHLPTVPPPSDGRPASDSPSVASFSGHLPAVARTTAPPPSAGGSTSAGAFTSAAIPINAGALTSAAASTSAAPLTSAGTGPSASSTKPPAPAVTGITTAKTDDPALAAIPPSSAFGAVQDVTRAHVLEPPPPPAPQPFSAQIAKPVFTLAAAGPGEHIMTVKVTPEDLGPVTVQAHIGTDGVKVQLFAPTDAGRAAVQAALPELRRDLAAAGLGASLDLSARSAPQESSGGAGGRDSPEKGGGNPGRGRRGAAAVGLDAVAPAQRPAHLPSSDNRLDILA